MLLTGQGICSGASRKSARNSWKIFPKLLFGLISHAVCAADPEEGHSRAGARCRVWGLEPAGVRSSQQQGLCPASASSAEGASSHHPQDPPGASVQLYPTSAGRQGDVQPCTAPPALPFPAALGVGCFQLGFQELLQTLIFFLSRRGREEAGVTWGAQSGKGCSMSPAPGRYRQCGR